MLAAILAAMLIAGLNYNSNLGLAFAFLMASMALVTMHHCNRNLLRLSVDVTTEVDAFAGREAVFEFVLQQRFECGSARRRGSLHERPPAWAASRPDESESDRRRRPRSRSAA